MNTFESVEILINLFIKRLLSTTSSKDVKT